MSHVAKIDVTFTNTDAIKAVCKRMGASFQGKGFYTFFDDTEVGGLLVTLPNWQHPMVIKPDGSLVYDNYEGEWGDIKHLNQFKQLYAVETTKIEAESHGYSYVEETLPNNVLKVTINI